MKTSQKGIELIKKFEGFAPEAYLCPANYLTIGYGHVITKGEGWDYISKSAADALLKQDLIRFEKSVERLITAPLTQNQFDALVSFTYNLGAGALQRSTLRMCLNRKEYYNASQEILKWTRGGGRVLPGLVTRRKAEQLLFLSREA